MPDIVDCLRSFGPDWTAKQTGVVVPYEICADAADEIERLRDLATALRHELDIAHNGRIS